MNEPYIGAIIMFAGNFEILNWRFCNGQILPIASNTALFSILGTTYGGNGTTNFALPDLRGRTPIHVGQGPGLSSISLGEASGTESVTLNILNVPPHTHPVSGSTLAGNASSPEGAVSANSGALDKEYSTVLTSNVPMAPTGLAGGGQPVGIRNPYLGMTYLIAVQGLFPSRY